MAPPSAPLAISVVPHTQTHTSFRHYLLNSPQRHFFYILPAIMQKQLLKRERKRVLSSFLVGFVIFHLRNVCLLSPALLFSFRHLFTSVSPLCCCPIMHCIMIQFHTLSASFFFSCSQTHTLMLLHMVCSLIHSMCSTSRPLRYEANNTVAKV